MYAEEREVCVRLFPANLGQGPLIGCSPTGCDTQLYKKAHGSKKWTPTNVRETTTEVSTEVVSKRRDNVGMELQENRRSPFPRQDKDNDKNGKGRRNKKKVTAEENTPANEAH